MKKTKLYEVRVSRVVYKSHLFRVEAESYDEASKKALQCADRTDYFDDVKECEDSIEWIEQVGEEEDEDV